MVKACKLPRYREGLSRRLGRPSSQISNNSSTIKRTWFRTCALFRRNPRRRAQLAAHGGVAVPNRGRVWSFIVGVAASLQQRWRTSTILPGPPRRPSTGIENLPRTRTGGAAQRSGSCGRGKSARVNTVAQAPCSSPSPLEEEEEEASARTRTSGVR